MLFHAGSLERLHEIGALGRISRVSSVSGGSIAAAQLALAWDDIHAVGAGPDSFRRRVRQPLFDLAGSHIDVASVATGLLLPGSSIADRAARAYRDHFAKARLSDLPESPRFVFCATNLGSGALVRFSRKYTADYRVGARHGLDLDLGTVVAASAAFPPVLSPLVIELGDSDALTQGFPGEGEVARPPLAGDRRFTHRLELSDGGVYDNLGLQPLDSLHTVLVSDGGGPFADDASVARSWPAHMLRCWLVTDHQVRALRRHHLIADFTADRRNGAYWGIGTEYACYPRRPLPVHPGWAPALHAVPTRLSPIPEPVRKQLVNWGYCVTDAAIRSYVTDDLPLGRLPYPEAPLDGPPPPEEPSRRVRFQGWASRLLPGRRR